MLPIGSVLFSSRAPIGHIAITSTAICTNQGFKSFIPGKSIDALYLYFCLKYHTPELQALGNGATFKEVSKRVVEEYKIPLPPLATQKHIARVLEQADQLRKQAQQMESELNQLAQSVFLEMFGDPVTNPKKWPLCQLSDIASVQLGKMLSEKAKTGVSTKKYLRNANVRWRNIELDDLLEMDFSEREMKKFELQFGDLLVCEGGEVGRCAIWRNQLSDCYYQKALHRVRVKETTVTPEYLQEYFFWMATLGGLTSSVSEVTFSHLTAERLNTLKVPVPPHKMQEQYTNKVALVEKQRQQVVKLSQKYEETFNSLMQRAFNGELSAPERKAA